MNLPLINIIVPTYNRSEMLPRAIDSLLCQKTDGKFTFEILIIDDASTDGTSEIIKDIIAGSQGSVKSIQGEGKGYTCALNKGVSETHGEWLALFDDDELAEPDWLLELFSFAEKLDAYSIGGRRILAMPEDVLSRLGPVSRGMLGDDYSSFDGQEHQPKRECHSRSIPIGGNMLIKRDVFKTVGIFDESMLTGGCDRDLSLRIMDAGFKMGLTPKAIVRHVISPHRITPKHMRWYSLQFGNSFAYIDWKRLGGRKTILACVGRNIKALFFHLPLLLLAYIKRSQPEIQDRKILLWRIVGYTGKTLSLIAPSVFPHERLFAQLAFRKERETLIKDSKASG